MYRHAAERGAAWAQYEVGSDYFYGGGSFIRDDELAIEWLNKAATQGHVRAKALLALVLRHTNTAPPKK